MDEMEAKIRILIVEDDKDWLRGLSSYLAKESDLEVTATAETREQAVQAIQNQEVDVILMDIMLSGRMEGIDLTEEVIQYSQARVIMLTSLEEKKVIFDAFQAGAIDYQIKSNFEEIPDAIRAAYLKKSPINAAVAEQMRNEFRRLKELEQNYKYKDMKQLITPSEVQVLEMIHQGHTQTEIADHFVISIRTVKNHVNHILKKMGVSSSKEAADKAKENKLF
jgi:DNA-binding NarL/FixJ family response regulator